MTNPEDIAMRGLNAAIRSGDSSALARASNELESIVFDQGFFSDRTVAELSGLIRSDAYACMPDSVMLLKLLEYNIGLLTEAQVAELVSAIVAFIPAACDEVGGFLGIELVVEFWKDQRSADSIRSIRERSSSDVTLALVAHGLHWLVKRTHDVAVREDAIKDLEALAKHPASLVAAEARAALARIGVSDDT